MGRSYFRENCQSSYDSACEQDNGTIWGATVAAFNVVALFPCQVIWHAFMILPDKCDTGNGGLAMVCAGCCAPPAALFCLVGFAVCVGPGIVSGLGGLVYGSVRELVNRCF